MEGCLRIASRAENSSQKQYHSQGHKEREYLFCEGSSQTGGSQCFKVGWRWFLFHSNWDSLLHQSWNLDWIKIREQMWHLVPGMSYLRTLLSEGALQGCRFPFFVQKSDQRGLRWYSSKIFVQTEEICQHVPDCRWGNETFCELALRQQHFSKHFCRIRGGCERRRGQYAWHHPMPKSVEEFKL